MPANECGQVVPDDVKAAATAAGCLGGVKYVYRDGDYGGRMPVASLGCRKATRFQSDVYRYCKVPLSPGWVAFRSWRNERPAIPGLSPPLRSCVGEVTVTAKIDGSPLVYKVEDEVVFLAASNPKKAFCVQKLRMWDERGFEHGLVEYRICYYMIAHKPRMKDRWAFGQYAPMLTAAELMALVDAIREKGWLVEA